jgi:hypothetical protein
VIVPPTGAGSVKTARVVARARRIALAGATRIGMEARRAR